MNKTVLIAGASGQDGFYLSQKLNNKGYKVIGLSRKNRKLEFCDKVIKTNYNKSSLVKIIKKFKPKIIFNFAGETSPKVSWRAPFSTINSIIRINQNEIRGINLAEKYDTPKNLKENSNKTLKRGAPNRDICISSIL